MTFVNPTRSVETMSIEAGGDYLLLLNSQAQVMMTAGGAFAVLPIESGRVQDFAGSKYPTDLVEIVTRLEKPAE